MYRLKKLSILVLSLVLITTMNLPLQGIFAEEGFSIVEKVDSSAVASIPRETEEGKPGFVQFKDLQDAIDAAKEGETVTLHKNTKGYFTLKNKKITIDMGGKTVTASKSGTVISGYELIRAFNVSGGDVTIKNGTVVGANSHGYLSSHYYGGVVAAYNAKVTLDVMDITGNKGDVITASGGSLTIDNTDIHDNSGNNGLGSSGNPRGMVYTYNGAILQMTNSSITGMTGRNGMAAIYANGGAATLTGCDITGNSGYNAGGIYFTPGSEAALTLNDTTVKDNVCNSTTSCMGGLYITKGTLVLNESAIYENRSNSTQNKAGDLGIAVSGAFPAADQMVDHGKRLEGYVYKNGVTGEIFENGIPAGAKKLANHQYDVIPMEGEEGAWKYGENTYRFLRDAAKAYAADTEKQGKIELLKDVKETDVVPAIGTAEEFCEIDLGGFMLTASSDSGNTLSLAADSHVTLKNGTVKGGRIGVDIAGACDFEASDVTFIDAQYKGINVTTGDQPRNINIEGCRFVNCGNGSGNANYAIYVIGNLTVKNSTFEDGHGGIYTQYGVDPLFEDLTFKGNSGTCISFKNIRTEGKQQAVIRNCVFKDNNTIIPNATTPDMPILYLYAPEKNPCEFLVEGCEIVDNSVEKLLIDCVGSTKPYIFKDCLISGNYMYSNYGVNSSHTWAPSSIRALRSNLVLEDTVIKSNKAEGVNNYATGGVIAGGKFTMTGGAIYGNEAVNTTSEGAPALANDILEFYSTSVWNVPAAKDMKDGDKDFSNYIWKEGSTAGELEGKLSSTRMMKSYTARVKKGEENVAAIGTKEYRTLEAAFADAKDGDTIKLIVQQYDSSIDTIAENPIDVDKKVTLDINGIKIDSKESGQNKVFTIKSGGDLTIKDSKSDAHFFPEDGTRPLIDSKILQHTGNIITDIPVEEGGKLTVDSVLPTLRVIHRGESVKLNRPIYKPYITLGKDKFVELGDDWDYESGTLNTLCKFEFTLNSDVILELNSDEDTSDVVLTKGGGSGITRISTVKALRNSDVRKIYDDGKFILRKGTKAIYIDGRSGMDTGTGAIDDPVLTFGKARELLEASPDMEGIIVKHTVKVAGNENWNLKIADKKYKMTRWAEFPGNLVSVARGAKLTLTDISIDGQGAEGVVAGYGKNEGDGSLVYVNAGGELTVGRGAVIENNYMHTSDGWTSAGGGIYSAGITRITGDKAKTSGAGTMSASSASASGGIVRLNKAVQGAGIYQVGKVQHKEKEYGESLKPGKLIMDGGSVESNRAVYCDLAHNGEELGPAPEYPYRSAALLTGGGGVQLGFGAVMDFTGGTVKNNSSANVGGGISLGNTRVSEATIWKDSGTTSMNMSGSAVVDNNYASSEGGGIYVQISAVANIMAGTISNNRVYGGLQGQIPKAGSVIISFGTLPSHGGAGIYVNGASQAQYKQWNASNSGNDAKTGIVYLGPSEIAYNSSGTFYGGDALAFCATADAKLFELNGTVIHDNNGSQDMDIIMTTVIHSNGRVNKVNLDKNNYYVSEYSLNGNAYDWKELLFDPTSTFNTITGNESIVDADRVHYGKTRVAMTTDLSEETTDLSADIAKAKVRIVNNASQVYGGGIGSNGAVYNGLPSPLIDVNAEKTWEDNGDEEGLRPDKIKVLLQRKVEGQKDSAFKTVMSREIEENKGSWSVSFKEQPEYETYVGDNNPANVKYVYRIVEDGTYKPIVEGSKIWTGGEKGKTLADIYETASEEVVPEDGIYPTRTNENSTESIHDTVKIMNFKMVNFVKKGNLEVSKKVTGTDGEKDRKFEFKVKLSDDKIAGQYGDMVFAGGEALFTLAHGEMKKATGLPVGITYTVTEKDVSDDGYTAVITDNYGKTKDELADGKGKIVSDKHNVKGKVVTDNTAKVEFENKRIELKRVLTKKEREYKEMSINKYVEGANTHQVETIESTFVYDIEAVLPHGETKCVIVDDMPEALTFAKTDETEVTIGGDKLTADELAAQLVRDGNKLKFTVTKQQLEKYDNATLIIRFHATFREEVDLAPYRTKGVVNHATISSGSSSVTTDTYGAATVLPPLNESAPEPEGKPFKGGTPLTGDESMMLLFVLVAAASGIALVGLRKRRKKH